GDHGFRWRLHPPLRHAAAPPAGPLLPRANAGPPEPPGSGPVRLCPGRSRPRHGQQAPLRQPLGLAHRHPLRQPDPAAEEPEHHDAAERYAALLAGVVATPSRTDPPHSFATWERTWARDSALMTKRLPAASEQSSEPTPASGW